MHKWSALWILMVWCFKARLHSRGSCQKPWHNRALQNRVKTPLIGSKIRAVSARVWAKRLWKGCRRVVIRQWADLISSYYGLGMAVPRFYKFVRRFDQDVQRCRGGFSTPAHVYTRIHTPQDGCRSLSEDCTRLKYGFCHTLARLCYVWKRLQPDCVCFLIYAPYFCFLNKSTISKFNTAWVKCTLSTILSN